MSEDIKITENEEVKAEVTEETAKSTGDGEMVLAVPIRAKSKDVEVLKYDFTKVTGKEYIAAMDSDRNAPNPFRMTTKQAVALFAAAAAHETEDVDARDIIDRMSGIDTIYAAQLASVFFLTTSQAASKRTVKE